MLQTLQVVSTVINSWIPPPISEEHLRNHLDYTSNIPTCPLAAPPARLQSKIIGTGLTVLLVRMGTKSKADSSQSSLLVDKLQTQPGLKLIVFYTFKSILSSSKCDSFSDSSFSDTEQTLIDSQTEMGWQHLLFWQFSSEWASLQDQHINTKNLDKWHLSSAKWISKVTSIFGKHFIPYGPYTTNHSMDPPLRRMMLPDAHAL